MSPLPPPPPPQAKVSHLPAWLLESRAALAASQAQTRDLSETISRLKVTSERIADALADANGATSPRRSATPAVVPPPSTESAVDTAAADAATATDAAAASAPSLPTVVVAQCLAYLVVRDHAKHARVSREWRACADDDELWREVCGAQVRK